MPKLASDLNAQNNSIVNLSTPVNGTDAATKDYVDSLVGDDMQLELHVETDSSDESLSYIGEAQPGSVNSSAVWRIKRIQDTGTGGTHIEFADGDSNFDNIWDDRESLSYS